MPLNQTTNIRSFPPWNFAIDPDSVPFGPFPGIKVISPLSELERIGNDIIRYSAGGAFALLSRVKTWRLYGTLEFEGGGDGFLDVLADAVDAADELIDEPRIAAHGGWYGVNESLEPWEDDEGVFDPGPISLRLWPVWEQHPDDVGQPRATNFILPKPELIFDPFGFPQSPIVFGDQTNSESCRVQVQLPATPTRVSYPDLTDLFDGWTPVSPAAQLQLYQFGPGSGANQLSGDLILTPVEWFKHDRLDGDGPVYDQDTGAWLRLPPLR